MKLTSIVDFLTEAGQQKLSIASLTILSYLATEPSKRASATVLASVTGISTAAITGQLDKLESRLLVRRDDNVNDRRALWAVLTTEGMEILNRLGVKVS